MTKNKFLPFLASRLLNVPLIVRQERLQAILAIVGARIGVDIESVTVNASKLHAEPSSSAFNSPLKTQRGVVIVPIYGTLVKRGGVNDADSGLISYSAIEQMVFTAINDSDVAAIVLDIDSPGGEVGGCFELAELIYSARDKKPIWSIANDAFSGGYLLASATQKIYIPLTAGVGSVGVIATHVDASEADKGRGLKYTSVIAGKRKADFSPHEPLSDSARNDLQAEVHRLYEIFVSQVAKYRGIGETAVQGTEAGIYFGAEAVEVGFADKVGSIQNALADLAVELAVELSAQELRHSVSGLKTTKELIMTTKTEGDGALEAQDSPPGKEAATDIHGTLEVSAPPVPPAPVPAAVPCVQQTISGEDPTQRAQMIHDLCVIAGVAGESGAYIVSDKSSAQVRQLLYDRQMTTPEIQTHITAGTGTGAQAEEAQASESPVVLACKQMAEQQLKEGVSV